MKATIGDITIHTFYVKLQKVWMTLAHNMTDPDPSIPMDVAISATQEGAVDNHENFLRSAELTAKVMPTVNESISKGVVPDIDALVLANFPFPPGTLLN